MNLRFILLLLASLMVFTNVDAQKRKTTSKKKKKPAKTTKVVKATTSKYVTTLPIDSLYDKAFTGVIGKTVVDFFGTRETYGDVSQMLYIPHSSAYTTTNAVSNDAIIRQMNGNEEQFIIQPYTYNEGVLTIGEYTYKTLTDGTLELQEMKQKNESRIGSLSTTSNDGILKEMFRYGKYLDGMSIQEDEDKKNSLLLLHTCKQQGIDGAKELLESSMTKRIEKGEKHAINYMLESSKANKDYKQAHKYLDLLLEDSPNNIELLNNKASIYDLQGKKNDAKKIRKKIQKLQR